MIRLNNKGQSLVLFVVFLPILLIIMTLVIDIGNVFVTKCEIDNVIEFILEDELSDLNYASEENKDLDSNELENSFISEKIFNEDELLILEDKINLLIDYNLKNNETLVLIKDGIITVNSKAYVEGIFSNILNIKGFKIESEYRAYIDNKRLEKVK